MTAIRDMSGCSVHEFVSYSPTSGELRWSISGRRRKSGALATRLNHDGYLQLVCPSCRKYHQAHRVAWRIHYGEWPAKLLDHINCVRADNRIENLRLADFWQNTANSRGQDRNGIPKGVHKLPSNRFAASIALAGERYSLGTFDTMAEASAAYLGAARVLFKDFARHE